MSKPTLFIIGSVLVLSLLMVACNMGYVPTTLPSHPNTPPSPTSPTPTPNPPPPATSTPAPVNKSIPVNKIANIKSIFAGSNWPYTGYGLFVEIVPTTTAVANITYGVDLIEKGNFRATTTVSWNQPEINVLKNKTVSFPLSNVEYSAYSGANVSPIFTVNVHEYVPVITGEVVTGVVTVAPVITGTVVQTPNNAAATELQAIQAAVFSMMVDNTLPTLKITRTAANATSNMSAFPGGAFVLYGNKIKGTIINYVAQTTTKGTYAVDSIGTVTQVRFTP